MYFGWNFELFYEYKKATNMGKFYLLPKIRKRLDNVPGRSVISNCWASTEKSFRVSWFSSEKGYAKMSAIY